MVKPSYILFYKNDEILEEVLESYPFRDNYIEKRICKNEGRIVYEHFDLKYFKMNRIITSVRGYKAWGIMIEEVLYNECRGTEDFGSLLGIIAPYRLVGTIKVI